MIPLNVTLYKSLQPSKENDFVCYPSLMVLPSHTRAFKKFELFHKYKKHDKEDRFILKKEIERLIDKGYLKQFVKGHAYIKYGREEPSLPN
jgi:hypothetical protein